MISKQQALDRLTPVSTLTQRIDAALSSYNGFPVEVCVSGYENELVDGMIAYYSENGWSVKRRNRKISDYRAGSDTEPTLMFA